MVMFLDTHCHLDDPAFGDDREEVIGRALLAGLRYILTIGTDLEGARRSLELAERYEAIYAAAAYHPHDAAAAGGTELSALRDLYSHEKMLAVGEIGLDFYYDNSPREIQERVFRHFLNLAIEIDKPVIIHLRNPKEGPRLATERFFRIFDEEASGTVRGIVHCFTGSLEEALEFVGRGLLVSIPGVVTFPKAEGLRKAVAGVPYESLLIETDAPYLAPVPKRGGRNEPAYVKYVAEKVSELRGITPQDLDRILLFNFETLFRLRSGSAEGRIAYEIRNNLYLNVTNRCTCSCTFCDRTRSMMVSGYYLGLNEEPSSDELLVEVGDPKRYQQIVFCGYGEPTLRLDVIKKVSRELKKRGAVIRLNTNGHGELIHGRDILPELVGLVDFIAISLNAADADDYVRRCLPDYGNETFEAVKRFIRRAVELGFGVTATAVELPGLNIQEVSKLAESLGARFRPRLFNVVG